MEWHPPGLSVCLPLVMLPGTIKSRRSFLLAPAHPGGPGKRAVKRLWCGGGGGMVFCVLDIPVARGIGIFTALPFWCRLYPGCPGKKAVKRM